MGRVLLAAVVWALLAVPQQPTFRSGVQTVALHATVRSSEGRLVPNLTADDFEVRDEGRVVPITLFSADPQPITVVLLLDMSGSMESHFLRVREATGALIEALRDDDRLRIGTFGTEIALSPWLTGDKTILRRVLAEELWPGGMTPLWTTARAAMKSLDGESGRRVILSLTDGAATDGNHIGTVQRLAQDGGFMFYAIGIEGSPLDAGMVSLTNLTGGGHFALQPGDDLAATFTRVIEELRHQYVLGFTPPVMDGKTHAVSVRVKRPGMNVRARKNYKAPGRR